ncbi:hypothetical protein Gogos_000983, partial [Gossypium gossypioides]|nr:hypothetical protein [Gossypium gossypioides]
AHFPIVSWKDKLLGRESIESLAPPTISTDTPDVDLEFEDGDIFRSTVNGIPTIDFSK